VKLAKGEVMKRVRRVSSLAAAGLIGVVGIGTTGAGAAATHSVHAISTSAHVAKTKKLSFTATYNGTVKILWGASNVDGTMSGTGKATTLGSGSITASGATTSFSTSSSSDPLRGSAVLKGPGGSLTVSAVNVSATTTSSVAPTSKDPDPVTISGTVKVSKGTGKFVGATGTLSVHASFTVNTTSGSEKQNFNATLKGSLNVKA
jgi:hypothetical protein